MEYIEYDCASLIHAQHCMDAAWMCVATWRLLNLLNGDFWIQNKVVLVHTQIM